MSLLLPLLRRVSVSPAVLVSFSDDRVARDASDRTLDGADEVVWDIHNLQGASSTARQKLSAVAMGSIPSLAVEVVDGPSVGRRSGGRNRVSFDLSKITTHEITPYAEVPATDTMASRHGGERSSLVQPCQPEMAAIRSVPLVRNLPSSQRREAKSHAYHRTPRPPHHSLARARNAASVGPTLDAT